MGHIGLATRLRVEDTIHTHAQRMRCNPLEENLVLFIDSVRVFCKQVHHINIINVIIGNNGRYSNKNANVRKI